LILGDDKFRMVLHVVGRVRLDPSLLGDVANLFLQEDIILVLVYDIILDN
jgi:hypothetical protein